MDVVAQCFVSDRTPRVTLVVLLGRSVSQIVTRWFTLWQEREKPISAGSGRFKERNTLLPRMTLYTDEITVGDY
jgi:hypothetical protein